MIFMPASQFHVCLFCSGPSDCYCDIFANLRLKLLWTLARLDSTGHPRATPWSLRVTSTFLQRLREEHGTWNISYLFWLWCVPQGILTKRRGASCRCISGLMICAAFRPFYRAIVLMKCKFRQFLQSVLASPAAAPSPGPGPNQLRSEARGQEAARVLRGFLRQH